MTNKKHGGPAFPINTKQVHGGFEPSIGMTLRDYFAAKAIVGMVASEYAGRVSTVQWAKDAYEVADAMLAVRDVNS